MKYFYQPQTTTSVPFSKNHKEKRFIISKISLLLVGIGIIIVLVVFFFMTKINMKSQDPPRLSTRTKPFQLSKKLENKTKENFEIVVARYDEDLSWCENYKNFVTIYNKGENDLNYPSIPLENKGHLADTILRHIITNYDVLADVTFFSHGSYNYRRDQIIKEKGKCHRFFEDFVSCDANTFVIIPKKAPPGSSTWYNYPTTLAKVYKRIFHKKYENNYYWSCGKWISVSKEKIRKSPKEIYQRMLDFVLEDWHGKEPPQNIYRTRGIFIERIITQAFV